MLFISVVAERCCERLRVVFRQLIIANVRCRFQEIAGAVETALYTPFAEATGLLVAVTCLQFVCVNCVMLLANDYFRC